MSYGLIRRLSRSARSSVVSAVDPPEPALRSSDIARGWVVDDLIGRRLGRVAGIEGDRLVIDRGRRRMTAVPLERVAEARAGIVRLTVLGSELR